MEKRQGWVKLFLNLLKHSMITLLGVVTLILNNIVDSSNFPEEWALRVMLILFKDGTKSDLNNYRRITLLSMLRKILVGVLNNRLWEVVNKYYLLRENQAGLGQGYRTTDHIFTLTTIISHYVNKNKKNPIFMFCGFQKKHLKRWITNFYGKKFLTTVLVGGFLNIIKSMYEKVKSCVGSKEGLTNFFNYDRGVRQGCLHSPLLFSLYINDVVQCLVNEGAEGVEL